MEKELKYTIEDDAIAELFGRQNFSSIESAIFELIKNCFDSGANECVVSLSSDEIRILDDGDGMTQKNIEEQWMHIGKSWKGYKDEKHNRVLAGSKGVGRFALARLGNNIELLSKTVDSGSIRWTTDWKKSFLFNSDYSDKGTKITITNLREKIRKKDVERLIDFLNRSYNSHEMAIYIEWESTPTLIVPIYEKLELGTDYTNQFDLIYSSKDYSMTVNVKNDEFLDNIKNIVKPLSISSYQETMNMFSELLPSDKKKDQKKESEELKNLLTNLGSFSARFYFGVQSNKDNTALFHYKHSGITHENSFGVILYRNNFSISSFEGSRDWLNIQSRARKSPAAATHPTGSWRVRINQMDGYVLIDKEENKHLVDLANRQGLEDNDYYKILVDIISKGITIFERYRQTIIRKIDEINKENSPKKSKESEALTKFLKNPENVVTMSKDERKAIKNDIADMKKTRKREQKEKKSFEEKMTYDNRILNVLATQGLRASSVAHEYHTKNNAVGSAYDNVVAALKEYGYWDDLNSDEKTKKIYKNVPALLERTNEINIVIGRFMETMLKKIERKSFSEPITSIEQTMKWILTAWNQEYSWVDFELSVRESQPNLDLLFSDVFTIIFDNLILNSIQHNENKQNLLIKINMNCTNKGIVVSYEDNGVGLPEKYRSNPRRILEVHESSRNGGHGLGMWMVYNALKRNHGEISDIGGTDGFHMKFYFGGKV